MADDRRPRPTSSRWLRAFADARRARTRTYLTELDSAIGDADHGVNMDRGHDRRGRRAGRHAAGAAPGALLKKVGHDAGHHGRRRQRPAVRHVLPADGRPRSGDVAELDAAAFAAALRAGLDGVVARGKAEAGRQDDVRRAGPGRRRARRRAGRRAPARRRAAGRRDAAADAGRDATDPAAGPQGPGQLPRASAASATRTRARRRRPCWSSAAAREPGAERSDASASSWSRTAGRWPRAAVALAEEMVHGERPRSRRRRAGRHHFGHRRRRDRRRDRDGGPTAPASSC